MKDYPYPMQARNEALCPFTRDTQLSGFLTLPKSLLCWGLSPGALLVYGLLLDRGKLSQRSGWTDKQGWVYVIFPVRELALALGKGVTTIKRWLRELEERELIFRTVPFQGEAGWIFLRVPRYGVEGEREKALGLPPPAPAVRDPWEERAWAPREGGLDPTDDVGRMLVALERSGGQFSTAPSGSGPGSSPGTPRSNPGRGRGRIWAISKIISQSKSQSNPIMGGGGKGRFPPPWFGWGRWGFSPAPLERAGTEPSRAGPYFFEEIGERTPREGGSFPLEPLFSGGRNGGR